MQTRFVAMPYPGSSRPFLAVLIVSLGMWALIIAAVLA